MSDAQSAMSFVVTDEAKDYIATVGYDTNFGAQPLGRAIQNEIADPLAEMLLLAAFVAGDTVKIDAVDGKLDITKGEPVEERKPEPVAPSLATDAGCEQQEDAHLTSAVNGARRVWIERSGG